MNLRRAVLTFGVAAFAVNGAAIAAGQDAHQVRKGSMVNVTACVTPSIDGDADEFVLTNVVDVPAHPATAGKVFYWLADRKQFTSYVGKRVQFDAEIDAADRMIIEIKHRDGSRNNKADPVVAEIDIDGDEIWIKPELIGLSSAMTDPDDDVDVPVTSVKLRLRNTATVVSGACNTAMTTEIAAAETETARVETPAAGVAIESAPAVTETRSASMTTRTALPATATPLAAVLLLGLGSLSGAAALRLRRRK